MIPIAPHDGKRVLTDEEVKKSTLLQAQVMEMQEVMKLPRAMRRRYRGADGSHPPGINVPIVKPKE